MTTVVYSTQLQQQFRRDLMQNNLQSFSISFIFTGGLPHNVVESSIDIPLHVSVSLPEDYAHFTQPMVQQTIGDNVVEVCLKEHKESQAQNALETDGFFLPLPSKFFHQEREAWVSLVNRIQNWLVNSVVRSDVPEWKWGREAFWMAFIGAYPDFPRGAWPCWDARISMEGPFIESWMEHQGGNAVDEEGVGHTAYADDNSFHNDLWIQFNQHASLYSPNGLVISNQTSSETIRTRM